MDVSTSVPSAVSSSPLGGERGEHGTAASMLSDRMTEQLRITAAGWKQRRHTWHPVMWLSSWARPWPSGIVGSVVLCVLRGLLLLSRVPAPLFPNTALRIQNNTKVKVCNYKQECIKNLKVKMFSVQKDECFQCLSCTHPWCTVM